MLQNSESNTYTKKQEVKGCSEKCDPCIVHTFEVKVQSNLQIM